MTLPLIKHVYLYKNKKVIVESQILFYKVYTMTYVTESGNIGAQILVYNWWDFMLHAKYIMELPKLSKAY